MNKRTTEQIVTDYRDIDDVEQFKIFRATEWITVEDAQKAIDEAVEDAIRKVLKQ